MCMAGCGVSCLCVCVCVVVDLWACCECGVGSTFGEAAREHRCCCRHSLAGWALVLGCMHGATRSGIRTTIAFVWGQGHKPRLFVCYPVLSKLQQQWLAGACWCWTVPHACVCAAVHHPGCVDCCPVWRFPCSSCCSGGALWLLCRHAVCGSCTISSCVADWATICVSRVVLALYITAVRMGACLPRHCPAIVMLSHYGCSGPGCVWCSPSQHAHTHAPHLCGGTPLRRTCEQV